ncbi:Nucleolar MIF4G domain-containing protein 1 [Intoshia linei]|uniref:Nucleolar MIF4G domain-containing protein 1 n=1 Tax=Intoshia linei TaxID=1819745 RepID=A0A177AZB0_9BILA|nr:Nucleolar MIF4G domain-containing protein 1 [Intoshia linei]
MSNLKRCILDIRSFCKENSESNKNKETNDENKDKIGKNNRKRIKRRDNFGVSDDSEPENQSEDNYLNDDNDDEIIAYYEKKFKKGKSDDLDGWNDLLEGISEKKPITNKKNPKNRVKIDKVKFEKINTKSANDEIYGKNLKSKPLHKFDLNINDDEIDSIKKLQNGIRGQFNKIAISNLKSVFMALEKYCQESSRVVIVEAIFKIITDITTSSFCGDFNLSHIAMMLGLINSGNGILQDKVVYIVEKICLSLNNLLNCKDVNFLQIRNLSCFLAYLYCYKVITLKLIYEILNILSKKCNERYLKIILDFLNVFHSFSRKEDSHVSEKLKNIYNDFNKSDNDQRLRFGLLELENIFLNKTKFDIDMTIKSIKAIKSCLSSPIGSNKIFATLSDFLKVNENGRWWVVGAGIFQSKMKDAPIGVKKSTLIAMDQNLVNLAKKFKMNTEIRINIFCQIFESKNYNDAFNNINKLNLNSVQKRQIVHVLFQLILKCKKPKDFYVLTLKKFVEFERNYKLTLKYTIWDHLKMIIVDEMESVKMERFKIILSKLIRCNIFDFTLFKIVYFSKVENNFVEFFRDLLVSILTENMDVGKQSQIFQKLNEKSHVNLKNGFKLFIKMNISQNQEFLDSLPNEIKTLFLLKLKTCLFCLN